MTDLKNVNGIDNVDSSFKPEKAPITSQFIKVGCPVRREFLCCIIQYNLPSLPVSIFDGLTAAGGLRAQVRRGGLRGLS
jgi:hypothetical protein